MLKRKLTIVALLSAIVMGIIGLYGSPVALGADAAAIPASPVCPPMSPPPCG